jgi:hypothetical protein
MSRAVAWRHQGGGAQGRVFVWPALGAASLSVGTGQHRPWLLYGRKGGAHGQLFVWDRVRGAAAESAGDGGGTLIYMMYYGRKTRRR